MDILIIWTKRALASRTWCCKTLAVRSMSSDFRSTNAYAYARCDFKCYRGRFFPDRFYSLSTRRTGSYILLHPWEVSSQSSSFLLTANSKYFRRELWAKATKTGGGGGRFGWVEEVPSLVIHELYVCLCWDFTAQSTTRSCRAGQLIVVPYLGRLRPSKRLTSTKRGRPRQ